ncbi:hypothetical protein BSFP_039860 [Burkholderia stabilis]|uniref:Uncharacterized protein n=1 Tax=Burkholderia stabilis TaxID=95485 RepID=A0A1Y1BS74_9BURK|nr:hypothetical protein BSFP_039860 [Burkholderia stabilis]
MTRGHARETRNGRNRKRTHPRRNAPQVRFE